MRDWKNDAQTPVVVGAVRTPVGRGDRAKGKYGEIHPADLLGQCFSAVLDRSGVDPGLVDQVIAGCVYQIGEQSGGITRNAWLQEGLPEGAGATTVDVRCGSGQQAVNIAGLQIATGVADVVVAGGVEHMGRLGFPAQEDVRERWGTGASDRLRALYDLVPQGEGAELIADRWNISRDEMDTIAVASHERAQRATEQGDFEREIVPVTTYDTEVRTDQGIRPGSTLEKLAKLRPAFREEGRVTAGNSSQISDGAAALLLTSEQKASELGLRPRVRIVDQVVLGVDPVTMLTGPIPATQRILDRNGLKISDLDVVEINEAFASVVLAWAREHNPDLERVNPRGGAIALGHPLGATGARLITTLVHELEDLDGELGLVTMCCGGGVGTATLFARI